MPPLLGPGDLAPWFVAPVLGANPAYGLETAAGRMVVLLFLGSGRTDAGAAALGVVAGNLSLFDDEHACLFGLTSDPSDAAGGRIAARLPGVRWFLDYEAAVARAYGAVDAEARYLPHWLLLDPALRVVGRYAIHDGRRLMSDLGHRLARGPGDQAAPVLVAPGVLEPELCRTLIGLFDGGSSRDSGFLREENGMTVERFDPGFKRRRDLAIEDQALIDRLKHRLAFRLRPLIQRAFQFEATRIERWLVACYDAADGGHFAAHRDNTTRGAAHRRFACTINLNAEDYEGGDLCFPEFGERAYRAPTGGAVVFSCALLHAARPVTRGRRYAFLPFFFDEAAEEIRTRNKAFVQLQGQDPGRRQH